jgi:hypothetical protein
MKKALLYSLCCLFLSFTGLCAGDIWWSGGISSDWGTPGNWGGGVLPGSGDQVYINQGDPNTPIPVFPVIAAAEPNVNNISIGDWGHGTLTITSGGSITSLNNINAGDKGDGTLYISGGTVTANGMIKVGYKGPYGASGNGDVNMTSGTLTAIVAQASQNPNFAIGLDQGGFGQFHLSGGTVNAGIFQVGAWGPGSMSMSGGTLNVLNVLAISPNYYDANLVMTNGTITGPANSGVPGVQQVWIGYSLTSGANGELDMYGGSITASWALQIGYAGYSTGQLNIYGGTFNLACDLYMDNSSAPTPGSGSRINVAGGQLIIQNKWRTESTVYNQLLAYKASGQLVAYGGAANTVLHIDEDSPSAGQITVWGQNLSQQAAATNPTPASGATVYSPVTLGWLQGTGAVTQNVYVGTDQTAVTNATTASPEYKGFVAGGATSFVPTMVLGQTYYWRIDTVKSDSSVVKGPVWSVTLGAYFVLENCESYTGTPTNWTATNGTVALAASTSNLGYQWGYQHGQAVIFSYNNASVAYGEAVFSMPTVYNTTLYNGAILRMDIHGDPNNVGAAEPVTVILVDSSGNRSKPVTYSMAGNNNGMIQENWEPWYSYTMSLGDFVQSGFNAASVKKIIVHVGGTSADGAHGRIFIDDIRVYPPMCTAQHELYGDFNFDCKIDMGDLFSIARDWLMGPQTISASAPPTPILWYKFNESSGAVAHDEIAGNNGTLNNGPTWVVGGGPDGSNCIKINGGRTSGSYGVSVPAAVFANITNTVSFSVWVKGDSINPVSPTGNVFTGSNSPNSIYDPCVPTANSTKIFFQCPFESGTVSFGAGLTLPASYDVLTWTTSYISDWRGGWVHYACVKDGNAGTMELYRNGILVGCLLDGATKPISDIKYFWVGATQLFGYAGMIDDFRIYNVALTPSQVISLANKTSVIQPILNWRSDANGDGTVNFADFAAMASGWLKGQQLWPHN